MQVPFSHLLRRTHVQYHLNEREKQRPTSHPLSGTPLIMTQAQLFGFIKVDFNLIASIIDTNHFPGVERQVGGDQISGLELQPRNNHHDDTCRACTTRPDSSQQHLRIEHVDGPLFAPHLQSHLLRPQALRKSCEQLVNSTLLSKKLWTASARRLTQRSKIDDLVTPHATQDKLT